MEDMDNGKAHQSPAADRCLEHSLSEDEIDLRQYIDIIFKRKKLILGVFLLCTIFAVLFTLLLPKVYKASASIMIMPSKLQSVLSPSLMSLDIGKISIEGGQMVERKPAMSVSTHETLLKSNVVMERLIDKLNLKSGASSDLAIEQFFRQLKVESSSSTNILELVVFDKDPNEAKEIANIWADEYVLYSMELISGEIKGSRDFIVEQFEEAQENLVSAEEAVDVFDVNENLGLMQIELTEDQNQLDIHYLRVSKFQFVLDEKRKSVEKMNADIAALTEDGLWLGSYGIGNDNDRDLTGTDLQGSQKELRQRALASILYLRKTKEEYDSFVNESGINLLKQEIEHLRKDILNDRSLLAQIEQLGAATETSLKKKEKWDWQILKDMKGPITEGMSDLTVWQILSLAEGNNFFETRAESLRSKIEKREDRLKVRESTLFGHEQKLAILEESVAKAQLNYTFYLDKIKDLVAQKNSAELEIATIEFDLAYSTSLVNDLQSKVKTLKIEINGKKLRLADLNRKLDICKKSYDSLAFKAEEARIAKALELGEVKVVSKSYKPTVPVKPKRKVIVCGAGFSGLMLGIMLAFIAEFWQKRSDFEKKG